MYLELTTMTTKPKATRGWATYNVNGNKILYVTLKYNDWYIAPSERNRFKVIPVLISPLTKAKKERKKT